jgi:putative DNA primase/helicase
MKHQIAEYLQHNEVGDAELFVSLFKSDYCYDRYTRTWYKWGGNYWIGDNGEGVISDMDEVTKVYEREAKEASGGVRREMERRITLLNTYQRRSHVLKLVAAKLALETDIRWDNNPWLMPCANGVINLKTGEIVGGKPGDYLRSFCPTMYRGLMVTCPRWEKFLLEIMDGDKTMVGYLRRLIGYTLSGTVSEGVFPVLWGRGRNGKGTMLEVLGKVLGDFATPVSSSLLLEQTYTRNSAAPSPDLMRLQGKRLVWASESDEDRKLSLSTVKWLTGNDSIVARPLKGMEISFRPTHTLFMISNHKLRVEVGDYAIWQRVHLIPFKLSFVDDPTNPYERKRDTDLMRRLINIEDIGILTWAVRGCMEWQEYGLIPPKTIRDTTKEYEDEEDIVSIFLKEETETGGEEWIKMIDLYQRYQWWAASRGLTYGSIIKFGRDLSGRVEKRHTRYGTDYKIQLKGNQVGG